MRTPFGPSKSKATDSTTPDEEEEEADALTWALIVRWCPVRARLILELLESAPRFFPVDPSMRNSVSITGRG